MNQEEKNTELYKVALSAFFQNELEHDKIILGLATAGIGFFIAILKDQTISESMFYSIIIALIAFAITVIMILAIFVYNKKQVLEIIKNEGQATELKELTLLDKTKYVPFIIAIIASVAFTLSLTFQSLEKGKKMGEKETSISTMDGFSNISSANQSVVNVEMKKGFSGITGTVNTPPTQPSTQPNPQQPSNEKKSN